MNTPRTYPEGVSCWIDIEVADVKAAARFYAVLFGWTYVEATAPGSRLRYLIAQLDGQDVAGIGQLSATDDSPNHPATWNTYVAVEDVDEAAARIEAAGGRVRSRRRTLLRLAELRRASTPRTSASGCGNPAAGSARS